MKKWYFPGGQNLQKEGINNGKVETFKDNVLESLVREIAQNSLDAKNIEVHKDDPVIVSFNKKSVKGDDPNLGFKDILDNAMPLAKKTWTNENEKKYLNNFEKMLKSKEVNVLKISDYNTTGLEDHNWEALIDNIGSSQKDNVDSGGSFGIGKHAPFAASDFKMVFYNTLLRDGRKKSIGVIQFVSFDRTETFTTQGIGYLSKEEKKPFDEFINFGFKERTEPGTDVFIIGFNQKNWKEDIYLYAIKSFLVSLYDKKIVFEIEDQIIDKVSLNEIVSKLVRTRSKISSEEAETVSTIKNYYETLVNENTKVYNLPDEFIETHKHYDGTPYKKEDATFLLLIQKDDSNRRVLLTREAGMLIKEQSNYRKGVQFTGIFRATGKRLNERLKDMENPQHNDWIPGRNTNDEKRKNLDDKLLSDLRAFFRDTVSLNFDESIEEEIDAFGASDFLFNSNEDEEVGLEEVDGRKTKKEYKEVPANKAKEESNQEADVYSEGEDGEMEVFDPTNEESKSKMDKKLGGKTFYKKVDSLDVRVLENNIDENEYFLHLNIDENTKLNDILLLQLKVVGESGYAFDINIKEAFIWNEDEKENLEIKNNKIKVNIKETDKLLFKLDGNNRYKFEVIVFEETVINEEEI